MEPSTNLRRRNFILTMMGMVIVLNIPFILSNGRLPEWKEVIFIAPYVLGGVFAIGLTSHMCWKDYLSKPETKSRGRQIGMLAVLLSYPIMGTIALIASPFTLFFSLNTTGEGIGVNVLVLMSIFMSFAAIIIAFLATAWIAVPLGALIGHVFSRNAMGCAAPQKMPVGTIRRGVLFATLLSMGSMVVAQWIFNWMFKQTNLPNNYIEMLLVFGLPAFIAAIGSWYFVMRNGEARGKGALAGAVATVLTFLVLGIIFVFKDIAEGLIAGDLGLNEIATTLGGGTLFVFLAILFAIIPALPVGIVCGLISARNTSRLA